MFDTLIIFGRALLAATRGDGVLSEAERNWIIGSMTIKGYPAEIIDKLSDPAYDGDTLDEVIASFSKIKFSSGALIADAIRAASSDTYAPGEHAAVLKIAEALGLSHDDVSEIVGVCVNV